MNGEPALRWRATREAALDRLSIFAPRAGDAYARMRNFDFGPDRRDNVSMLSPWIARRVICEDEVLAAALARHSFDAAEKFVQEVFWRIYFKGWLESRPDVWTSYRTGVRADLDALDGDAAQRERYERALGGTTGIDAFDAWARELASTGYLHNHARMWFASIWIFTLKLPWRLGADFFLRHLLDGDCASNTLSWRWVAGLHTKGKTYLACKANIERYTDGRFSPPGLVEDAQALEETAPHPKRAAREARSGDVDPSSRIGLLLTDDDMSAETLFRDLRPAAIAGASFMRARSPHPAAGPDMFTQDALSDGLRRASALFGAPATRIDDAEPIQAIIDWAVGQSLSAVYAPFATVGPPADAFERLARALVDRGILLVERKRDIDALAWPHCQRGFFALKKKIPECLEGLSLA